ncbi:MAG: hypothetical protein HY722_17360, partial [Planctomycetes bacterium]|nr:hypothetical protein [Planctomycetota bacterium]
APTAPLDGAREPPPDGDEFAAAARLALQPSREPLLLGEIALARGYLTRAALDAALDAQELDEAHGGAASLGEVLIAQGALDPGRLEELMRLQDEAFRGTDPVSRRPREDILFAQLAVQKGLVSQPEMNRVLRTQGLLAEQGRRVPLGRILVDQGLLSTHLVQNLLAFQRKRILRCPACGAQFTVHRYRAGNRYRCARCPGELEVPSRLGSLEVEGVIDGG